MAAWPAPWERTYRPEKTLAYLDDDMVVGEDGRYWRFGTWPEVKSIISDNNLLCYVDDWPEYLIVEAVEAGDEVAYSERQGRIVSISWRLPGTGANASVGKHRVGSLRAARSWQIRAHDIARLRALFQLCGVGDRGSPSALGLALMVRWLKTDVQRIYHPPALHIAKTLWENSIGGRVDTIHQGREYETLWEEDRNGAYIDCARRLPCGRAIATAGSAMSRWAAYYCYCNVTIMRELVLGPVGVRRRQAVQRITRFPWRPGVYQCWLWDVEADAARAAGCTVELGQGWGWETLTDALDDWAWYVYGLRAQARELGLEDQVKLAAVAALGRFGSDTRNHTLTKHETGDPFVLDSGITEYWIQEDRTRSNLQQAHWYGYIQAQQRVALYNRAVGYAASNELVATNYDALYQSRGAVDSVAGLGGWRCTALHNARVPAPRHLISREKTRLPGVARSIM